MPVLLSILHLVVSSRNSQYISGDRPADVPHNVIELMQQFGRPGVACGVVTRPDEHTSVLQKGATETETKISKNISHLTGGDGGGCNQADSVLFNKVFR